MKLKHIRWICYALFAAVMLFACLMYAHPAFGIGALASIIALAAINLVLYRCPYCKKHLGREIGAYCQHCGEELDQN